MQLRFGQILRVPEVKHISYNMGTRALPDMYALSPRASGIHIRQSTRAHVITYTCNTFTPQIKGNHWYT